jgi:O-antigen ligase
MTSALNRRQPPFASDGRSLAKDAIRSILDDDRVRLGVELLFIAAWLLLRLTGAGFRPNAVWTVGACALALVWPGSGLVVLVAGAPWAGEAAVDSAHILGLRNLIALTLAASVVARMVLRPASLPRSRAFWTGALLGAVTLLLGVGSVFAANGVDAGWTTALYWLSGLGAGILVFVAAVWVGSTGQRRALWAAVIASSAAGILSMADYALPGLVGSSPLAQLLTSNEFGDRLSGAIASPNAMVSLLVTPTGILVAALLLARDRRLRIAAGTVLPLLLLTMFFTYSRSMFVGVFVIAVVVLWRWRRAVGAGLLLIGLVGGIVLGPAYISARGDILGGGAQPAPGKTLIASDVQRITAWEAASAMWLDAPLLGHGFRSYYDLSPGYGDSTLNSPHNEWIRLFAEEGLVGGLVGLAWAIAVCLQLVYTRGWLAAGALGGFAAWALTASFNNPFLYIQVSAIALTVGGVMIGARRSDRLDDRAGSALRDAPGSTAPAVP